jgi:5-methylcytosine-specific restriction endonuclease McrA
MASGWISKRVRMAIYRRDNDTCCYCGAHVIVPTKEQARDGRWYKDNQYRLATLDHVVSRSELASVAVDAKHFGQLKRDPKNLVTACGHCNGYKQHKTVYQFCHMFGYEYSAVLVRIGTQTGKPLNE